MDEQFQTSIDHTDDFQEIQFLFCMTETNWPPILHVASAFGISVGTLSEVHASADECIISRAQMVQVYTSDSRPLIRPRKENGARNRRNCQLLRD